MSIGQLYIITTRATTRAGEKIKERWLVNASSAEEAQIRLKYQLDISVFETFAMPLVEKVKSGAHQISRTVTMIDDEPKYIDSHGAAHIQRTNQHANPVGRAGATFAVGFAGSVGAVDDMHALRLVAQFLIDHSMNRQNTRVRDDRVIMVEAVGESDSTAVSKLENPYTVTRMFRGGAIGAGR